ncbi:hypothetical protein ABI_12120 [Asticcacaulis biprosthecium C19]|uniref:Uncharacterized protein n=1 Tax=Asticcacaulis biprosthecium C19 TaxID=715226 RepID=F4QHN8_9CAUL|nr:SIMPL domain-containing protein [Asticcacaulis biprosthecium]EGF92775.1 hypothetical protein ABI_12120 [Asticcacaulis biprosthecium C19]
MRPLLTLAALLALATTSVAAQTAPPANYGKAPWWMKDQVITQTGFVYTEVPANRAAFSATFLTTAKTVEAAQAQAFDRTRGLQQSLAGLGKDKLIVSTAFAMRAQYEQYRDKDGNRIENVRGDKITGYEVTATLTVEVRDISQLQPAYGRVMAASPTSASDVRFWLQPDKELIAWLDRESIRDAKVRAQGAATASGATLGRILTVDATGRACHADILAPPESSEPDDPYAGTYGGVDLGGNRKRGYADAVTADDIGAFPDNNVAESLQRIPGVQINRFSAENIEAQALKNPFLQTPPLVRKVATACVVYALN